MPTLKQFRYLVTVAETLHFRRAAERCHVTQPTLSGQIKELEERLGVQLIERGSSGVLMTPVGERVVALARGVLREVDTIVEIAKHGQQPLSQTLRLGTLHSLGPYLLPLMLPDIHKTFPHLKLFVREGLPRDLLHSLEDGKLDLLFFPLPAPTAEFVSEPLFRESLLITLPAEHKLTAKSKLDRSDLKGETVLALEAGHRLHEQVRDLCQQYGAELSVDYEGTSLDTLRQMVGMGMGLSFLPALYVRAEMEGDSQAVVRPMAGNPPSRIVGMVWRRRSSRGEEYSELARFIRTILSRDVREVLVLN